MDFKTNEFTEGLIAAWKQLRDISDRIEGLYSSRVGRFLPASINPGEYLAFGKDDGYNTVNDALWGAMNKILNQIVRDFHTALENALGNDDADLEI